MKPALASTVLKYRSNMAQIQAYGQTLPRMIIPYYIWNQSMQKRLNLYIKRFPSAPLPTPPDKAWKIQAISHSWHQWSWAPAPYLYQSLIMPACKRAIQNMLVAFQLYEWPTFPVFRYSPPSTVYVQFKGPGSPRSFSSIVHSPLPNTTPFAYHCPPNPPSPHRLWHYFHTLTWFSPGTRFFKYIFKTRLYLL